MQRQMVVGRGTSPTSLSSAAVSVIIGQFICWGWWVFGVAAFFYVPSSEGEAFRWFLGLLSSRCCFESLSSSSWLSPLLFQMVVCVELLWNPRLITTASAPIMQRESLCTVNFIISLLSTWWTENTSLNCLISRQDPSSSVSLVCSIFCQEY